MKEARYVPPVIPNLPPIDGDRTSHEPKGGPGTDHIPTTGQVETTTTSTTPGPIEPGPGPVGDCPCGATQMKEEAEPEPRILAQDTGGVTRPWLAHINIQKDSGEPVECTGSLLNL